MQIRNQTHFRWQVKAFACIFLLITAGLLLSHSNQVSGGIPAQIDSPSNPDLVILQGLQTALTNDQLNTADRQSLEQKLALHENLVDLRSTAGQTSGPKGPAVPLAPVNSLLPEPTPDARERIIEGSEGLVHPWEAMVQNLWQGQVNGVYYQVLAGSHPDNSSQGLLVVIQLNPDQNQRIQWTYLAPAATGALRIIERQGGQLVCSTTSGGNVRFDIVTRTFQQQ